MPAARDGRPRTRVRKVGEQTPVRVEDLSADRHAQLHVLARTALLVASLAVTAPLGREDALALEERQIAQVGIGEQRDVPPVAAVAAVRTTLRDVLLTPEAERAVPAPASTDLDAGPVVEQRKPLRGS
jgi:hypothetical protein